MDVKEYIASGILEEYALGTTTAQETKEVECMAKIYPEIKEELEAAKLVLEQYAIAHQTPAPASAKNNIMAMIEDTPMDEVEDTKPVAEEKTTKVVSLNQTHKAKKPNVARLMAAASIALLVAFAFMYSNKINELEEVSNQISDLQTNNQEIAKQLADIQGEKEYNQEMVDFLSDPSSKQVAMAATGLDPNAAARVFWNSENEETYLVVDNLPTPPEGKQYQLWAIVDGAPTDMGMLSIDTDSEEMHKMKPVANAQAFAITLEDEGGKPSPNLEMLYVIGNV